MKIRKTSLSMLGLSAALGMTASLATAQDSIAPPEVKEAKKQVEKHVDKQVEKTDSRIKAKVGEAAPDFTLEDAKGKEHKLSDFKGKLVVLQWINPKCPYCIRVTSNGPVEKMREELIALDKDIVYLTINSTATMPADMTAAYLEKHKLDVPGLIDQDGTVGHLYGAKTTPHMYVIDAEGVLRYQGAIDDDVRGEKGDDAMNYIVNAVTQIKAGETVAPDYAKPYGCSVKYARK